MKKNKLIVWLKGEIILLFFLLIITVGFNLYGHFIGKFQIIWYWLFSLPILVIFGLGFGINAPIFIFGISLVVIALVLPGFIYQKITSKFLSIFLIIFIAFLLTYFIGFYMRDESEDYYKYYSVSDCEKIKKGSIFGTTSIIDEKEVCFIKIIQRENNYEICDRASNESNQDICNYAVADQKEDKSICDLINDKKYKKECVDNIDQWSKE